VDRQTTCINEDNYFVTNRSQPYTLQIEEGCRGAETFNIHFGEFFSESVLNSLVAPEHRILDGGPGKQLTPVLFFNQLHRRDATFNGLIRSILALQTSLWLVALSIHSASTDRKSQPSTRRFGYVRGRAGGCYGQVGRHLMIKPPLPSSASVRRR